MTFETLEFMERLNPQAQEAAGGGMIAAALAKSAADDAREAAAEREAAEAKRAAAGDRMEGLAIQNRALGDPLGEISRARSQAAAAGDEVAELRAQLERAEKTLARARDNIEFWASRMQTAQDSAQRSATPAGLGDLGERMAEARRMAAEQRVDTMLARARARAESKTPGRPEPRERPGDNYSDITRSAPPAGTTWRQISQWVNRGWCP